LQSEIEVYKKTPKILLGNPLSLSEIGQQLEGKILTTLNSRDFADDDDDESNGEEEQKALYKTPWFVVMSVVVILLLVVVAMISIPDAKYSSRAHFKKLFSV